MNNTTSTRPLIIGIDHGYGNIKTPHSCFKTGVTVFEKKPVFTSDLLAYDGKYYVIGEGHKEFAAEKMNDPDYYILTLAAIARELYHRNLSSAEVYLAVGLPLTWVSGQKDSFKAYLLQNQEVSFTFQKWNYHVAFAGASVFPQGFSAIADRLQEFMGVNMLCDIGNGTMNIMYINHGKPVASRCFTEKFGTQQCMISVREKLMRRFGTTVDDSVIEDVLRFGEADIGKPYLDAIRESAVEYASGIMRRLREHEYNPELMKLYVMGGGSCLIQNFVKYDPARVTINTDIRATARGYETLAAFRLDRKMDV